MKRVICFLIIVFFAFVKDSISQENKGIDFEVVNNEVTISASIYLPSGVDHPVPAVIFIPGSAQETGDSYLPYVPIINGIGYAVVIYDKRGVGKSTGEMITVSSKNSERTIGLRAADVNSIVNYLINNSALNLDKIGLIASSQGAWVASELYKLNKNIGFIINCSGGVASVGASDYYDEIMDDPQLSIKKGNRKVRSFKNLAGFDPLPIIKQMTIPVLWLYGELDRSHPGLYDIRILKKLNKPNFKFDILEHTNHDLIDINTNTISEDLIKISLEWMSSLK